MRLLDAIRFRVRGFVARDAVNAEFDDELRDHIARETAANIARGLSPDDARRQALADFGGVERFKESLRDERGTRWLTDSLADLRHGVRLIRKNPLFSGAVIGTLALGIGATSTIFTIVNGVLLQTPSYPAPDRVVSVSQASRGEDQNVISASNYRGWLASQHVFSAIAAYSGASATLTGAGEPRDLNGAQVTPSFFTVFAARPAFGRLPVDDDAVRGAPRVVVLSHALFAGTFGSDSTIVGRTITVNGNPREVVGIMPASFDMPATAQYWTPLAVTSDPNVDFFYSMIGRLRDGVTLDGAERDLQPVIAALDSGRTPVIRGARAIVMSMHERRFGAVQKPLTLLFGAVVVLLLIACVNVANLTLARSAARQREFAVRLALGAGRWRLARQLFIETSLLALLGGGLGALVPFALVGAFVKLSPASLAGIHDVHVNGAVLMFTACATVAAALLFGLVPALTGSRGVGSVLNTANARMSSSRAHGLIRSTLVVTEIAAALTLLTGAGLLTKSFANALAIDAGFRPDHVYATYVRLPGARYDDSAAAAFYAQFVERIRGVPGVRDVARTSVMPLGGTAYSKLVDRNPPDGTKIEVHVGSVSAEFARAIALRLVEGRFIDERDTRGTEPVALVTRAYARQFFPNGTAVGRPTPQFFDDTTRFPTIVGVVEDLPRRSIDEPAAPMVMLAAAQSEDAPRQIVIRSSLGETALRNVLKQLVASIDPLQPLTEFYPLQQRLDEAYAPRRFNAIVINAFALIALVLASIGLYGLMANAVVARTREIGIRMALGARAASVLTLVLRQGLALTAVGIVLGVALSYVLARTLTGLLYEVTVHDPFVFALAPCALALVAFAASLIPARRATHVDPMAALRGD